MGHSIRYVRKIDSGFYRCLSYEVSHEPRKYFVLTYFDGRQNQFSFENIREFETEHAEVDEQELWLCRVDSDNDFWNRITIKIPHSSRGKAK